MMQIVDEWLKDLPQQFQAQRNIEILISAFARQLQQVLEVQKDLNNLTSIDEAHGKNLDYIGNILSITRKDARIILKAKESLIIDDETYRKVLKYKALRNTCECTYIDIMDSISLLWDTEKVEYIESPERPATVLLKLGDLEIDETDPTIGKILAIKPSGVALIYYENFKVNISEEEIETSFLKNVNNKMEILFFGGRFLDGTWILDGTYYLSGGKRYDLKPAIDNKFSLSSDGIETYEDMSITHRKNYWDFSGKYLLDGSRKFNAETWKEVVE